MKILVVEDDPLLSEFICKCLEKSGFSVESIEDGEKGYKKALKGSYDCLVLDINLPSMLGTEICEKLRREHVTSPILFLSSRHTTSDRIKGFEVGADDYLVKPFSYEELVARVKALSRRASVFYESPIIYEGLVIDTQKREVNINDETVKLTPKEFQLLELLARHPETVLSREYLLSHIWGVSVGNTSNRLEVCILGLRKKLVKQGSELISTEYGVGYKLSQSEN